ncbi:MAG: replication initiator protein A [Lachnospiraceae bacterium]|nr:replication initiator protein A [Lachnospiraceae bacterium]
MTEYLTTGANLPPYMIFPKFLLDSGLSETTKLLYMLLLDRTRLSMKNDGWTDAQGHAFIYFTIADMAAALHKGEVTIKKQPDCAGKQWIDCTQTAGSRTSESHLCENTFRSAVSDRQKSVCQRDRKLSGRGTEYCPCDRQKSIR